MQYFFGALAIFLIGLALGYAIALARSGARATNLVAELGAAKGQVRELQARITSVDEAAATKHSLTQMLGPLQSKVVDLAASVQRAERDRIDQYATLAEQLAAQAVVGQELQHSTTQLAGALSNASARGVWGEVELQRLVEAAGMVRHTDFSTQVSLADGARPDMVVHLPGDAKLAVDAKVPFAAYLQAAELANDSSIAAGRKRSELLGDHARAVRAHVDALAKRNYPAGLGDGPDLTVMFMPAEALLSAALEAQPDLLEYALRKRICLTSPVSLLALLRTVAAGWQREDITNQTNELLAAARTLVRRMGVYLRHVDDLGAALRRSVESYNAAVGSYTTRLRPQVQRFVDLYDDDIAEVHTIDITTRHLPAGSQDADGN